MIKFMADGRDNVSMQPVPMSNVRSKRQDRTYKVVAHTTETETRSTSMSNYGYTTEKRTFTMKSPEITTTCKMKKTSNITHHKRRKYQKIAISENMGSNQKVILHKKNHSVNMIE
jgi:hypothetical protein